MNNGVGNPLIAAYDTAGGKSLSAYAAPLKWERHYSVKPVISRQPSKNVMLLQGENKPTAVAVHVCEPPIRPEIADHVFDLPQRVTDAWCHSPDPNP